MARINSEINLKSSPKIIASEKGNLDQEQKNLQSTMKDTPAEIKNYHPTDGNTKQMNMPTN